MPFRGYLTRFLAFCLGKQTERFRVLDQRRRFMAFQQQWRDCPKLEFPYSERERLYRYVQENEIGGAPIDYLEFGCFKGESILAWAAINAHPESRFFGFDSFEGLPENWQANAPKGTFSVGGDVPQCQDSRVTFIKGWFQNSLPGFLHNFQPQSRLVVHLDADLYSSTLYALVTLNPAPGSILIFDEFSDILHEFRAFEDYLAACDRKYRVIAARTDFHKLAMEIL